MRYPATLAAALALFASPAQAQSTAAPTAFDFSKIYSEMPSPPADPAAIALRPAPRNALPEQWLHFGPVNAVRNVVAPTLTPVLPDPDKVTGAAVIVAPGGAFRFLSYEAEGTKVARWLADHGIAAFVLKYRTVPTPRDINGFGQNLMAFMSNLPQDPSVPPEATPEAVEDGLAAIKLDASKNSRI